MAITNPTAVTYSNEKLRVTANKLAQAFNFINAAINEWDALDMGSIITDYSTNIMEDDADTDGRPVVSGQDLNDLKDLMDEFRNNFTANTNAKLNMVLKVAVNTTNG